MKKARLVWMRALSAGLLMLAAATGPEAARAQEIALSPEGVAALEEPPARLSEPVKAELDELWRRTAVPLLLATVPNATHAPETQVWAGRLGGAPYVHFKATAVRGGEAGAPPEAMVTAVVFAGADPAAVEREFESWFIPAREGQYYIERLDFPSDRAATSNMTEDGTRMVYWFEGPAFVEVRGTGDVEDLARRVDMVARQLRLYEFPGEVTVAPSVAEISPRRPLPSAVGPEAVPGQAEVSEAAIESAAPESVETETASDAQPESPDQEPIVITEAEPSSIVGQQGEMPEAETESVAIEPDADQPSVDVAPEEQSVAENVSPEPDPAVEAGPAGIETQQAEPDNPQRATDQQREIAGQIPGAPRPGALPQAPQVSGIDADPVILERPVGEIDELVDALHESVRKGDVETAAALIGSGVNLEGRDAVGRTPLLKAAAWGTPEMVALLLEGGAQVNVTQTGNPEDYDYGSSPLMKAADRGHSDIVQMLIAAGADIEATDRFDRTALHLAVGKGHGQVVERLVSAGADVNAQATSSELPPQFQGLTPLMGAVLGDQVELAEMLVAAGADPTIRTVEGKDSLDLARERGNQEIVSLLSSAAGTEISEAFSETGEAGGATDVAAGSPEAAAGSAPTVFGEGGEAARPAEGYRQSELEYEWERTRQTAPPWEEPANEAEIVIDDNETGPVVISRGESSAPAGALESWESSGEFPEGATESAPSVDISALPGVEMGGGPASMEPPTTGDWSGGGDWGDGESLGTGDRDAFDVAAADDEVPAWARAYPTEGMESAADREARPGADSQTTSAPMVVLDAPDPESVKAWRDRLWLAWKRQNVDLNENPDAAVLRAVITEWDGRFTPESTGPVAYDYWRAALGRLAPEAGPAAEYPPEWLTDQVLVDAIRNAAGSLLRDYGTVEVPLSERRE